MLFYGGVLDKPLKQKQRGSVWIDHGRSSDGRVGYRTRSHGRTADIQTSVGVSTDHGRTIDRRVQGRI